MTPAGLPPELRDLAPSTPQDPLPEDLAVLGARLEVAAERTVARRSALRRTAANAALTLLLGVPLALAAAATDVAPSSAPVDLVARGGAAPTPNFASYEHHDASVHRRKTDLTFVAVTTRACVEESVCRAPEHPSPVPARLRKHY